MVQDAYRFVVPLVLLCALFAAVDQYLAAFASSLVVGFICYFFRNPQRAIPSRAGVIVSPADGKVIQIRKLTNPEGAPGGHSIAIFLNILDVHVNRSPIEGRIEKTEYQRGRFLAAYKKDAAHNEQNILWIRGETMAVTVRQIAGFVARRVVCWKKSGESLERGEKIGLIRFGSRVEVEMPEQVRLLIQVGDRVQGGSSIIGEYS